jgi:hypothetical protein
VDAVKVFIPGKNSRQTFGIRARTRGSGVIGLIGICGQDSAQGGLVSNRCFERKIKRPGAGRAGTAGAESGIFVAIGNRCGRRAWRK